MKTALTFPSIRTGSGARRRVHAAIALALGAVIVASSAVCATPAAARDRDRYRCDSCGTVVTTNRKDVKGSSTAGTVVGGVGGAVAGNVIGHDTTATVLGGVGGAVAGNVLERKLTRKKIWSVQVRMDRGDTQDVDFDRDPAFHQGDRVRIEDGTLRRM